MGYDGRQTDVGPAGLNHVDVVQTVKGILVSREAEGDEGGKGL